MDAKVKKKPFRFLMIGKIIRLSGFGYITLVFLGYFLATSGLIFALVPSITNFGDALWLCFQSITTIGYGDLPTTDPLLRILIVLLSLLSVFYLAIITGVVVSYCNNIVSLKADEAKLLLLTKLEHLEDLDKDELHSISMQVKRLSTK